MSREVRGAPENWAGEFGEWVEVEVVDDAGEYEGVTLFYWSAASVSARSIIGLGSSLLTQGAPLEGIFDQIYR